MQKCANCGFCHKDSEREKRVCMEGEASLDTPDEKSCLASAMTLATEPVGILLSNAYLFGEGVAKDLFQAYRLFRLSAEQGNPSAKSAMNQLHLR